MIYHFEIYSAWSVFRQTVLCVSYHMKLLIYMFMLTYVKLLYWQILCHIMVKEVLQSLHFLFFCEIVWLKFGSVVD